LVIALLGCGGGGGGGGGGGAAGAGSGGTGGAIAPGVEVDLSSASITKSFAFQGTEHCSYASDFEVIFVSGSSGTQSLLWDVSETNLTPHERVDTYDPAVLTLEVKIGVDGYQYVFLFDSTANSSCTTKFTELDTQHVVGSSVCTDLMPGGQSADFTGDPLNPGPHANATIRFNCPFTTN
jgi:hypothetical protein